MSAHLQTTAANEKATDAAAEAERLAALLEERRAELSALQEEFREFKEHYARTVGGRLSELAEVEAEIRRAESRLAGLDDEQLQSYCASAAHDEVPEDAAARLVYLKEELITIEFGIKRLKQDRLYHLMISTAEEARQGRDALAQQAATLTRKIAKARNRLAHLS